MVCLCLTSKRICLWQKERIGRWLCEQRSEIISRQRPGIRESRIQSFRVRKWTSAVMFFSVTIFFINPQFFYTSPQIFFWCIFFWYIFFGGLCTVWVLYLWFGRSFRWVFTGSRFRCVFTGTHWNETRNQRKIMKQRRSHRWSVSYEKVLWVCRKYVFTQSNERYIHR